MLRARASQCGRGRAARRTARLRRHPPDVESFSRKSWDALVAAGAVVRRRVTLGEVAAALAEAGAPDARLDVPLGKSDDLYVEIATALFTPAAIGGNLVGMRQFRGIQAPDAERCPDDFVASTGPYDFRGNKFFREAEGHRFDRLRVVQDGKTFGFVQGDYQWVNPYAKGIRGMQDAGLFAVPAERGLRSGQAVAARTAGQWRRRAHPVTVAFGLDYQVPDLQALTDLDDARGERRAQAAAAGGRRRR